MIKFAFYLHNHQPIGNFDEIFENAYQQAYLPLVKTLLSYHNFKFGIHNSGILLHWLEKKHPEFLDLIKQGVKTKNIDILSSAYGEPILSLIPKKDIIEQIKYFNDYLYKHFDYQARGLWITERIWEPGLIKPLVDAGIEYVLLDDTHFFYAGLEEQSLYSYYTTEEQGKTLKIFPMAMKLRYLIPFHPIPDTIKYLKEAAHKKKNSLRLMADDGEKFGVWHGTYDWVFRKKWLDNFLQTIEKTKWIEPVLLSDMIKQPGAGRIYIPTCSYEEMGGWVLPPKLGREYESLKKKIKKKHYYFIHGGYFRNFLRKYPEANLMHKRMLYVSKNIASKIRAKQLLWQGQCSCAYWHGLFGGLYLPHLRAAIYKNLLSAEEFNLKQTLQIMDFDADAEDEIVFSNKNFFFVVKPSDASFLEIDDRKRKTNLLNYLLRREEKYHDEIKVKKKEDAKRSFPTDLLFYDKYRKTFALDHRLKKIPSIEEFYRGSLPGKIIYYNDYKIINKNDFKLQFNGIIKKTIMLSGANKRILTLRYKGQCKLFAVEFTLGIFDPKPRLQCRDNNLNLKALQTLTNIESFLIHARTFAPMKFEATQPFTLLSYPIETISSSEKGLEKIFQGICLLLVFNGLPTIEVTI